MACPVCKTNQAAVMGPLFIFRRARWHERLLRGLYLLLPCRDEHRVAGLVKVWTGYECLCANAQGPHRYVITRKGTASTELAAPPRKDAPAPVKGPVDDDDEEPAAEFPELDGDLILPGERMR